MRNRHGRSVIVWTGVGALAALLLAAALVVSSPAFAFPAEVLESVVSVLPEWPSDEPLPERPEGSGVAVLAGGYIATNAHVLGRATAVDIRLHDGRVLAAEIVGRDPLTDIALLRAPLDLPLLAAGPEPALGDAVCALGNPFGLGLSLSCGVVSALHRTGTGFNAIEDFIQTDAAVNPGGSGGALIDGEGRLVGMVSAIFTMESDANIGVNFATSRALLMRVAEDLAAHGRVIRGQSGLRVADLENHERAEIAGARVTHASGAAEAAGLAPGDIITTIAGRAIRRPSDVTSELHLHRPNQPITIIYSRDGGPRTTTLFLAP